MNNENANSSEKTGFASSYYKSYIDQNNKELSSIKEILKKANLSDKIIQMILSIGAGATGGFLLCDYLIAKPLQTQIDELRERLIKKESKISKLKVKNARLSERVKYISSTDSSSDITL